MNSFVKLPAGWLIDRAGLKGLKMQNCGVHTKQALVLVNYGEATGRDICQLAQHIVQTVEDKFSVTLTPEVRLIGASGEISFDEYTANVENN